MYWSDLTTKKIQRASLDGWPYDVPQYGSLPAGVENVFVPDYVTESACAHGEECTATLQVSRVQQF